MATNRNIVKMVEQIRAGGSGKAAAGVDGIYIPLMVRKTPLMQITISILF